MSLPPKPVVVSVYRPAAHGVSQLTLADGGSDATELVGMLQEAMVRAGFAPEVADRVVYTGELVDDTSYGELT